MVTATAVKPSGRFGTFGLEEGQTGIRQFREKFSVGCRLKRDARKDQPLTYDDIVLPEGRLCDRLREEQTAHFRGTPPDERAS